MADVRNAVIRALVARTYPAGRPDGVAAPEGVGARVKRAHDEVADARDDIEKGVR
jgi:hypothetical protein